jgi:hypothetical protein
MKLATIEAIVSALNEADVRYLIVGGLAVAAHGYGRVTFDIDLVLQLQPDNVQRAIQALDLLGYKPFVPVKANDFADPAIRKSWIEEKNMVVFQLHSDQHQETRIDLFVSEPFDFENEYNNALIGEILPGLQTRFVGIETLIRMKEVANRDKDQEDIKQLKLLSENQKRDR